MIVKSVVVVIADKSEAIIQRRACMHVSSTSYIAVIVKTVVVVIGYAVTLLAPYKPQKIIVKRLHYKSKHNRTQ